MRVWCRVLLGLVLALPAGAELLWDTTWPVLGPLERNRRGGLVDDAGAPLGPPEYPTRVRPGPTYRVVERSGDLADQPLQVLDPGPQLPRVSFRLSQSGREEARTGAFRIAYDMVVNSCTPGADQRCCDARPLGSSGSAIAAVEWASDGAGHDRIRLVSPGRPLANGREVPFAFGTSQHVEVEVRLDPPEPELVVWIGRGEGAVPLGRLALGSRAPRFDGVAFSAAGISAVDFAFDNVRVERLGLAPAAQ